MKAAVLHAPNQPLTIEDVSLTKPQSREVLLRTAFAGLCHSDLHFIDGLYPHPTPCVLGHESAAVVEAVGDGVTYVKPGDHVITCLSVFCGPVRNASPATRTSARTPRSRCRPASRAACHGRAAN
jgi:S-(hydroxymethyl)glutathione dehydrogenase / alcohol dehydrogenase